jgi:spermidine synthase
LAPWLRGAEINRDRNLRLQYLAGMASNLYREGNIYDQLLFHRKYPEKLFSGSKESLDALKEALASPRLGQ